MGERIAGKQDRHSLIIAGPTRAPQIATNIKKIHFGSCMKNWFSIVFPCGTYVSTVMRSAFADILVSPVSLDFM